MQPIILTGGPCAGKTTLLNALAKCGYATYEEVSRRLICEQQSSGTMPWTDLPKFAQLCWQAMLLDKHSALQQDGVSFVDRALGDVCAYLAVGKEVIPDALFDDAKGYHPKVFICEPEASIYHQDNERPHSFEEAMAIHAQLLTTYQALGYETVFIPWGDIDDRVSWVLTALTSEVPLS